jgi:hypothetical protein
MALAAIVACREPSGDKWARLGGRLQQLVWARPISDYYSFLYRVNNDDMHKGYKM